MTSLRALLRVFSATLYWAALLVAEPSVHPKVYLPFKACDMRVMTVDEWRRGDINDADVSAALAAYHATRRYVPCAYTESRVRTLEQLIIAAHGVGARSLAQQAQNKLAYLRALPDPTHPWITLPHAPKRLIATSGGLTLDPRYWVEAADPLRRSVKTLKPLIVTWRASGITNFFDYLETVEYEELAITIADEPGLPYLLSDEERAPYRIHFQAGLAYLNGTLVTCSESMRNSAYVLGLDGCFYLRPESKTSHPAFFAAGAVLCAGEMEIDRGRVRCISNESGHYTPGDQELLVALAHLKRAVGSLQGIQARTLIAPGDALIGRRPLRATFDAETFLRCSGKTLPIAAEGAWNL